MGEGSTLGWDAAHSAPGVSDLKKILIGRDCTLSTRSGSLRNQTRLHVYFKGRTVDASFSQPHPRPQQLVMQCTEHLSVPGIGLG